METLSWVSSYQVLFLCPFPQMLLVDTTHHWIYLPITKNQSDPLFLKIALEAEDETPLKN